MSGSSRKNRELLDRVRYPNPIPAPPYVSKLVRRDERGERFADGPETRNAAGGSLSLRLPSRIAEVNPLPVVVDVDVGMAVDANYFAGLWTQRADNYSIRAATDVDAGTIDPDDAFLLNPLGTALPVPTTPSAMPIAVGGATGQGRSAAMDVTWLRRTEYLAMEQARQRGKEDKGPEKLQIDTSREAMVERIKATFDRVQKQPLSELRHPTKPGLRPVQCWDVLPDVDTWATPFQIVRFQDWPGRTKSGQAVPDSRIAASILRPDPPGVDPRLSFYLIAPPDADALTAQAVDDAKKEGAADEDDDMFGSDAEEDEGKKKKAQEQLVEGKVVSAHADAEREITEKFLKRRAAGGVAEPVVGEDGDAANQAYTEYRFQRDYVSGEADNAMSMNQYVFVLDDARSVPAHAEAEREYRSKRAPAYAEAPSAKRPVAYWHPVAARYILRPKRLRRNEKRRYEGIWDKLRATAEPMAEGDIKKRWRLRREVDDLPREVWEEVDESDEEPEAVADDAAIDVDVDGAESVKSEGDGKADADADADADAEAEAEAEAGTEADDEEKDKAGRKRALSDDSDSDGSDAEMDDDELAGLQEEAQAEGGSAGEASGDAEAGADGKRSRRAAAVASEATTAREQQEAPAGGDDDEED